MALDNIRGTTSKNQEHTHVYDLDWNGNGWTSRDGVHFHRHVIEKMVVKEAEGHTHRLEPKDEEMLKPIIDKETEESERMSPQVH